jgi:SecD/SecF fusion protein
MQKQKRWQFILILAVVVLTIYNILPTVFYYTKPLKSPITEQKANQVAASITKRINSLEQQSVEWLSSYCKLLKLKPQDIALDAQDPEIISLTFKNAADANLFSKFLPKAGALVPFVPSQLSLYDTNTQDGKVVRVQRKIPIHFDPNSVQSFFQYSTKFDAKGQITPLYQALINDRVLQLALSLGGINQNAQYMQAIRGAQDKALLQELISLVSENIVSFYNVFGENRDIAKRYYASFSLNDAANKQELIQDVLNKITASKEDIEQEIQSIENEAEQLKGEGRFLDAARIQKKQILLAKQKLFSTAYTILKNNMQAFASASQPWTYANIGSVLQQSQQKMATGSHVQTLSLEGKNPFIESLQIDWLNDKIYLNLYSDVIAFKRNLESQNIRRAEQADQIMYNELAYVSRQTDETVIPLQDKFIVELPQLPNSKSFLAFRLGAIAQAQAADVKRQIAATWNPKHTDLLPESFPILDYESYANLPAEQKKLCLVIYSPVTTAKAPETGFKMNSIYVIAKGMDKILKKIQEDPSSEQSQLFMQDFQKLRQLLHKNGFMGYEGSLLTVSKEFANDFIFESPDYYQTVLMGSREDFQVKGTKRYAILEFTDVEQRILTENKIDTRIHEDLLKWRDDYLAAQLNIKGVSRYDVPKPTQNVLFSNLKLSAIKYFRGDDRKILHWGLDLSGGKTVQIELRDSNNRLVTNEADIKQGINELYNRVNKMGVSEVSIRQEGNYITLDFPGSQGLSAAELVKASSMYFHVVNEKFTPHNATLAESVNRFLQEVWNEAVVTNRKEIEDINQIAWKHLYGDSLDPDTIQPRSESARILYENGLRLANPQDAFVNSVFNDTYSKIATFRGDDYTQWHGQTHPLLIVFRNFALEGSNLDNIHASYDPSRGNYLSFGIKGSYTAKDGIKISPQDDLFSWTTPFSKEKITGTPNAVFSNNQGWRMAVVLNGYIVSAPTLDSGLKDSAMITGSFSQREINQLEADLKAGSLSFTPKILSEKNVSPELGAKERSLGIWATAIALFLVIAVMVGYYRFGGLVASVAVIFNLLIMWATLQNIQATLTLASLAGLILTVGMAVDANVLVFERIREEFAVSGRIASAVQAGYKKAFSAIIDSNVTTIIAALILLNFDSGPIKGFAVTLIIGIVSSMFTALFMTRYFFTGWIQNPKNKSLNMMNVFKARHFNFLKFTKATFIFSTVVIVIGGAILIKERHTIMGMDFTGGYAATLEIQPNEHGHYRQDVENALLKAGAKPQDFQVRELTPSNNIRVFLSRTLELPGRPLHNLNMPSSLGEQNPFYENAKIEWLVNTLTQSHIGLTESSIRNINKNWSEVSGQMSEAMRNNAIIGLLLALLCILIYITLRFEFKYAISATLCLAHDIVFTIGVLALLHALRVPIQIDLNTVAALMTIVGYSLNDTIIVFDRIREDVKLMRKATFTDVINHALNVTLSRTIMTSSTTLLVLLPLIALGGSTIFGFALVMGIGVIFGTLSSLFIAAPLMLYFHKRELEKQQKMAVNT